MLFKVVLIGSSQVGKTCLFHRMVEGKFPELPRSTIGVAFQTISAMADGLEIKLQLWDTPGLEKLRSITEKCYNDAHTIIFVLDLTDQSSFDNIKAWLEQIKKIKHKKVCKMILGNKSDLTEQRVVDNQKMQKFVEEENIKYFKVSSKTGQNVEEALRFISTDLKRSFLLSKIIIVGSSPTGKNYLIKRLADEDSIGIDFKTKTVLVDGLEIKFQLWDTSSQEKHNDLLRISLRGAEGIIVMFDLMEQSSFDDIKAWLEKIKDNNGEKACKMIIGIKSDFQEKNVVDRREIRELVKEAKIPYYEVSEKTGENVEKAFLYLARDIKRTFMEDTKQQDSSDKNNEDDNCEQNSDSTSECNLF